MPAVLVMDTWMRKSKYCYDLFPKIRPKPSVSLPKLGPSWVLGDSWHTFRYLGSSGPTCHDPIYLVHTSDRNTQHPNIFPHISSLIASLKDSTLNVTPSHLAFNHIVKGHSHPVCLYLLIPSFLTKSFNPHYLPSLSPSFVVSATPWRSEWMKCLHTAPGLALMQDQAVRMSHGAG
jgi:hypothetical protein